MNQYFDYYPYGKVPCELDEQFSSNKTNLPNHSEKKQITKFSTIAGLCIIAYMLLARVMPKILLKLGWVEIYLSNDVAQLAIDTLISLGCIFIPFLIGLLLVKKVCHGDRILQFNKPYSAKLMILAVAIGGLALVISNFVTNMFVYFMESIGVVLTSPDNETFYGNTQVILLYLLRGALCPALIEEFAFRGVVMQPLRKYGDKFAIITSSILFALMHGNLVQAPFAFLIGLVIGYLVIITGTMWTGVIIHFLNNAYSIIMSVGATKVNNEMYATIFTTTSVIMVALGILAVILFTKYRKKYCTLNKPGGNYRPFAKQYNRAVYGSYFLSPMIIIALILIIREMTDFVSIGG